eukprot:CAMPEP_0206468366 /NCGR_PEP_ID=MMETSP0324_2-20121206/29581_1 /ASSEMBLY_ACC=CAM_ASM_000836 /TAXON_ID=2866 /ORGANISM="Crypthecodinium cohnii, Strain Seligo" /LENGTH=63 /DNA_ID=CAMNT_0053941799 /DNA_START=750 /DNA_END=941 /DNA_ORIENTATION=-
MPYLGDRLGVGQSLADEKARLPDCQSDRRPPQTLGMGGDGATVASESSPHQPKRAEDPKTSSI